MSEVIVKTNESDKAYFITESEMIIMLINKIEALNNKTDILFNDFKEMKERLDLLQNIMMNRYQQR